MSRWIKSASTMSNVRTLPCLDRYCCCPGSFHQCVSTCLTAEACTCWDCSLCGELNSNENTTVDVNGNPVGACCQHRLDEEGNIINKFKKDRTS